MIFRNLKFDKNHPQRYFQSYLHLGSCTEVSHFISIAWITYTCMHKIAASTTSVAYHGGIAGHQAHYPQFKIWIKPELASSLSFLCFFLSPIPSSTSRVYGLFYYHYTTCYSLCPYVDHYLWFGL